MRGERTTIFRLKCRDLETQRPCGYINFFTVTLNKKSSHRLYKMVIKCLYIAKYLHDFLVHQHREISEILRRGKIAIFPTKKTHPPIPQKNRSNKID